MTYINFMDFIFRRMEEHPEGQTNGHTKPIYEHFKNFIGKCRNRMRILNFINIHTKYFTCMYFLILHSKIKRTKKLVLSLYMLK